MSRQAVSLHVRILEECNAITVSKAGRERLCKLKLESFREVEDWVSPFKNLLEGRLDKLNQYLNDLQNQ